MLKTLEIDEQIFHKLVNFSSKNYQLPPLAAKIYAYLTFDFEMNGVTFEELVDDLKASKSSVSCSLDLLLKSKHITVLNKIDERKRFFILNPEYIKIRFGGIIERLEREVDILDDLHVLIESKNSEKKSNSYINKMDIYTDLLKSNITRFTKTLEKLYQ
jgi:DNA-binding transcriptional regulator GbsR (MarR family)